MIKTKQELKEYMNADACKYKKLATNWKKRWINIVVTSPINSQHRIFQYVQHVRYAEYFLNNSILSGNHSLSGYIFTLRLLWQYHILRKLSYKTGFQIPPGTCGPGLQIRHYGYLIINERVRCGRNLTIYPGVEIGEKDGGCPTIGNDVFIDAGAKIFGGITIGNNVTIGANAVVTKNIEDNTIVGGVPARVIRIKKSEELNSKSKS